MISILGIGTGGSRIAERFTGVPQYNVYVLNDKASEIDGAMVQKIDCFETPEEYEKNIPDLKKFFKDSVRIP